MRLLVVGANGLLGSNVVYAARQRDWAVSGTYHSIRPSFDVPLTQFDLRAYDVFGDLLTEHNPDMVVNCAAMTDVDECEMNPEQAHAVNGDAPGRLAAHCESNDIGFIHISTDYVFDGTAHDQYSESAVPNPVQVYGESKLAGERAVRNETVETLIARLSFVWGIHRNSGEISGFPAWVRDRLQANKNVPLFTDQWVSPTRAGNAADMLLDLIEYGVTGLVHVACTSCITPYEFGAILTEYADVNEGESLLAEGSIDDIERPATRPRYSCLDVERVESVLGRSQPTLREGIEAVWDSIR